MTPEELQKLKKPTPPEEPKVPKKKPSPIAARRVAPSELTPENYLIKGALLGPTGSGKTQDLITLPHTEEKPILLLDFDGRWRTLEDEAKDGRVVVTDMTEEDPHSPRAWDDAEKMRKYLWSLARRGDFPFSAIAEDGLTSMARIAMNSALLLDEKRGLGGAAAKQHYIPQIHYLVTHINSMRALPCHYILTGHFDLEKDEDDGTIKYLPKVTRSLRTEVPSWFNEVYYCFRRSVKGSVHYYWRTMGTGKYDFFKSTLNTLGKYWGDPIRLDFSQERVGFQLLMDYRFGQAKYRKRLEDEPPEEEEEEGKEKNEQ